MEIHIWCLLVNILIEAADWGYTAPLDHSLVFLCQEEPNLQNFEKFNDFSPSTAYLLHLQQNNSCELQHVNDPVLYDSCSLRGGSGIRPFSPPYPSAQWILFKLLDSSGDRVNIDAKYFALKGFVVDTQQCIQVQAPTQQMEPLSYNFHWDESMEEGSDDFEATSSDV